MSAFRLLALLALSTFLLACGTPAERATGHLDKAEALFEEGDLIKAKLEAQNALQIQPKNAEARFLLAKIAEKDEDFRGAIGHLLVAVDADPNFVPARVRLGNYYFLGQAVDEAAEQADAAMAIAPDDPEVQLLNARVLFLRGDQAGAMAANERALAIDPDLTDGIMFKAGMLAEGDDMDGAFKVVADALSRVAVEDSANLRQFRLQLLRRAGLDDEIEPALKALAADFPDDDQYQYALARLYVSTDREAEAEGVIRRLIQINPENTESKVNLVRLIASERGMEAAEAELKGFIAQEPDNLQLQLVLASLYESEQRLDDALTAYKSLASKSPTSEEGVIARNRLVAASISANDIDKARELNDKLLTDVPDDPNALLSRAAFNFVDGDYDAAVADLRIVLRKDENSERALLLLARSYIRSNEAVLAQDAYRRLLAVSPKNEAASRELAALLASQGDTAAAEDVLRSRLALDPEDATAAAGLVQTLLAQRDLAGAETEARKLVELNKDNALAQFQLGRVMQAKGSVEEAIAAYRLTLEQNPEATAALQGLAATLVQADRGDEAVAYLQDYVANYPDELAAQLLLADVYMATGQPGSARDAYERLLEVQPETARAYVALASMQPADSQGQIAQYQRGLKAMPGNATLGLMLASIYERTARYDDAIALYDELLPDNKDNLIIVNNLAALLIDYRTNPADLARGLELAKRLVEVDQPALLDTLGWAYYRNGDYPSAVRYLERAVAGAGDLLLLRFHLGMAYSKAGNPVGARQELTRVVDEAEPGFEQLEQARATLASLGS